MNWIRTSDSLPENLRTVLVTVNFGDGSPLDVSTAYYFGARRAWVPARGGDVDLRFNGDVVAWADMPTPFTEIA